MFIDDNLEECCFCEEPFPDGVPRKARGKPKKKPAPKKKISVANEDEARQTVGQIVADGVENEYEMAVFFGLKGPSKKEAAQWKTGISAVIVAAAAAIILSALYYAVQSSVWVFMILSVVFSGLVAFGAMKIVMKVPKETEERPAYMAIIPGYLLKKNSGRTLPAVCHSWNEEDVRSYLIQSWSRGVETERQELYEVLSPDEIILSSDEWFEGNLGNWLVSLDRIGGLEIAGDLLPMVEENFKDLGAGAFLEVEKKSLKK